MAKRVKLTALKSEKWTQIMTYFNNSKPVDRQGHGDDDLSFNLVWNDYFRDSPEDRDWSEIQANRSLAAAAATCGYT